MGCGEMTADDLSGTACCSEELERERNGGSELERSEGPLPEARRPIEPDKPEPIARSVEECSMACVSWLSASSEYFSSTGASHISSSSSSRLSRIEPMHQNKDNIDILEIAVVII